MVYLISYDLNKSGKNYDGVYTAIKEASDGNWSHPLESTWLIRSNYTTPEEVVDLIRPHIDSDDKLLVIEVLPHYQGWLSQEDWDYIVKSIFG